MIQENEKTVVIIGKSATGKTTLADKLSKEFTSYRLFRTDDYASYGYEQSLYVLMEDLKNHNGPKIIEGVQGYRLLRKGIELGTFQADLILITKASMEDRIKRYAKRGESDKIKKLVGFDKNLDTVWRDYITAYLPIEPRILEIEK